METKNETSIKGRLHFQRKIYIKRGLLPVRVTGTAVITLYHHPAPVAVHEVPVLHVVRTRVTTRVLTLAPGWTRVKEVKVGSEAGHIGRAVHELRRVVSVVISRHESDYSEATNSLKL